MLQRLRGMVADYGEPSHTIQGTIHIFPGGTATFLRADGQFATPPGGGTTPSGTGFRHVTGGTEDAASKLVANADVDANAGIVESKLSLNNPTHSNANDHAQAHTLASHSSRAHSDLTGIGATDHHSNALDHSNSLDHAQSHGAADHSGDVIPAANQDFGAFYSDISQIAVPANPGAGTRRIFVDSADGKLKVRTSAGVSTSLEEQGGGGATPAWKGALHGACGEGDPEHLLRMMLHNPINPTPTNIGTTVARIAYMMFDTAITINKIRFFGAGATTNVYRVAIYRDSDSARLTSELAFTTGAQAWGAAGAALNLTLAANTLYFIAVSVNATGTTAGVQACSATAGRIGVLPSSWPGNLALSAVKVVMGFAQFAVTSGALPATAPARVAQAAWTGGMLAFFLDNNDA